MSLSGLPNKARKNMVRKMNLDAVNRCSDEQEQPVTIEELNSFSEFQRIRE